MIAPLHRRTLGLLLVAASASGQAPPPSSETDWLATVTTAVEHSRFAVRRAAAARIAQGGDAAVPAIRRYQQEHGPDSLPLELIDAIARAERPGPFAALLREWATDREFYWRAQALDGLARHPSESTLTLCRAALDDPSYLYRLAGARGLASSPLRENQDLVRRLLAADPDPRARGRVALLLLENGDDAGLAELIAIFDRADESFLDDPWGRREALFAARELERITGADFRGALADDPAERAAGREGLIAWVLTRRPDLRVPPPPAPVPDCIGGIEVRSCRNGDLHLRWTADGMVIAGLSPITATRLDAADLTALEARLYPQVGREVHGRVVCDYLRVFAPARGQRGEVHHKAAPGTLPQPLLEWLKAFGRAIEKGGSVNLERELEARLEQFASARKE